MKIISWNINGIRAVIKKGFDKFLESEKPDVLCLQEIKISDDARNKEIFDFAGYQEFWHSAARPGYSGTMTLVKDGLKVLGEEKFSNDPEGRVQTLEFEKFYLCNIYFVNAQRGLSRLKYKIKWSNRLLTFLKKLEKKKPLIICGDFNVAHKEIDLARPKENQKNAGFTLEERGWMTKLLKAGFVDVWRAQHPDKVQYTWWIFYANARARNIGWRIDYFCVSDKIFRKISSSFIEDQITSSDHCPVGVIIKQ
jgi:exodeoxyribonuclease III